MNTCIRMLTAILLFGVGSSAGFAQSADDAIRSAIEAIDSIDSAKDEDASTAFFGQISQSIEVVERSDPRSPWLLYLRGAAYALSGHGGEAANNLQAFIRTREGRNEWRAHRMLGDLFIAQFPRLAQASFEAAAKLKAGEPTVLDGLSKCALATRNIDEAVKFARQAVDADGRQSIRYLRQLASALTAQQSWTNAQRAAEQALALAEKAARNNQGQRKPLEVVDQQYALLIDILQRHTAVLPTATEAYLDLARFMDRRADNASALSKQDVLAVLKAGVENTAPSTAVALQEAYAVALAEAGRRDEAVAAFKQILEKNPRNRTALDWLSRLQSEASEHAAPPRP